MAIVTRAARGCLSVLIPVSLGLLGASTKAHGLPQKSRLRSGTESEDEPPGALPGP